MLGRPMLLLANVEHSGVRTDASLAYSAKVDVMTGKQCDNCLFCNPHNVGVSLSLI
jgi:hypothetical protein